MEQLSMCAHSALYTASHMWRVVGAGQRRYRVNIEWSGAREQNNKSEN